MTLPASPPIKASDINIELGRAGNAAFDINGSAERTLAGVPSGAISFSDFLGKAAFSVSYLGNTASVSNNTTYTFSGESLGVAASSREIFVAVSWNGGVALRTLSSATIGGISATIQVQDGVSNGTTLSLGAAIISAAVPTGTTGNIVCTFSGSGNTMCDIGKFRVVSKTAIIATAHDAPTTSNSVATTSVNINVGTNGALIAAYNNSDTGNVTWGNITKQYEGDFTVAGGHYSGALTTGLSSQVGRNITTSQNTSGGSGTAIAVISIN